METYLKNEGNMQNGLINKKIACIDLEGTLAQYSEWLGENHFGNAIPGGASALETLRNNNWLLIIFTTRTNKDLVMNFLESNNIPYDYINENPYQPSNAIGGKPYADLYIDDRAIQFNGDWTKTIEEALNFKPWEKRATIDGDRMALAKEFLTHDFDQCNEQLRHYDNMSWDITKFSFVELLVGITAIWAIFGFAKTPANADSYLSQNYLKLIPIILGISYIFSLLASFLISRNRVYYAKVARYINEHRRFSLELKPMGFSNSSEFYTSLNIPHTFNTWSTHLVSLYVLQLISAILFGGILFCICLQHMENEFLMYYIASLGGLISFVVNLWINIAYMKKRDIKPDQTPFGNPSDHF